MKKILSLITLIVILSSSFVSFAGEKGQKDIPAYRNAGYRGNVNIDNYILVWLGIETSHGYMINTQNYIGAGAEFFMLPFDDFPMFGTLFGEYQLYFQKDGSTPTAGIGLDIALP